ncbi:hypothetical protein [Erwinia mallotivora]|uniref:hypothetical protein n=1 Tax=Erwinia mallotivora TaxID=69222 RepID=UPI0021BDF256|nr:hypothetical protein [Erwinia mallotivora]
MQEGTAVISVNGIEVGAMPLEQYEAIVRGVKKDWRTRMATVFSYVSFTWKVVNRFGYFFVQLFPVIFAILMIYFMYHQPDLTRFISELRSLPSESIASAVNIITRYCIFLTGLAVNFSFIFASIKGTPFFVSATESRVNNIIREIMEVPAKGTVKITFKKDGVYGVR